MENNNQTDKKFTYPEFRANIIFRGKIICKTGLHIGGSKEKLQIGGLDSPVVRNPFDNMPYIPGSSLKGKMRHLLEYITPGALAAPVDDKTVGAVSKLPQIVRVFGIGAEHKDEANKEQEINTTTKTKQQPLRNIGLTRLTVRDAYPDKTTMQLWKDMDTELEFTEFKPENTIDRLTSAANPRFIERVVAGSRFNFEMVYTVYEWMNDEWDVKQQKEQTQDDLDNIIMALKLLESSAIGKAGSRGYGKIQFYLEEPHILKREQYKEHGAESPYSKVSKELTEDLNALKPIYELPLLNYE